MSRSHKTFAHIYYVNILLHNVAILSKVCCDDNLKLWFSNSYDIIKFLKIFEDFCGHWWLKLSAFCAMHVSVMVFVF